MGDTGDEGWNGCDKDIAKAYCWIRLNQSAGRERSMSLGMR